MARRDPESVSVPLAALVLAAVLAIGSGAVAVSQYRIGTWYGASPPAALPTFLFGDGPYYRATLLSLTQDHDLDLHNQLAVLGYRPDSNVALGRDGQWYPKHAFVLPLFSAPFFAIAGDTGLLVFNVIQLVALLLVAWWLVRRHAPDWIAAGVCVVFAFTTLLRPAAYNYSPDVLAALIFAAGLLALVNAYAVAAGLLLGLSVWAKLPNLFLLLPPVAFAVFTWRGTHALKFACALAAALVVFAAINVWMFGSPVVTSYDRVIAGFTAAGPALQPSHRTFYDVPFWTGLWRQMLDRRAGLVVSAPVVLLAPIGFIAMWRRNRRETMLIAATCAIQIVSFAKYRLWNESRFGHRFLILTVVLSAVPVGALLWCLWDGIRVHREPRSTPSG